MESPQVRYGNISLVVIRRVVEFNITKVIEACHLRDKNANISYHNKAWPTPKSQTDYNILVIRRMTKYPPFQVIYE